MVNVPSSMVVSHIPSSVQKNLVKKSPAWYVVAYTQEQPSTSSYFLSTCPCVCACMHACVIPYIYVATYFDVTSVPVYAAGDLDPAIRQEVWRFLYGLYPANSTHRWAMSSCSNAAFTVQLDRLECICCRWCCKWHYFSSCKPCVVVEHVYMLVV